MLGSGRHLRIISTFILVCLHCQLNDAFRTSRTGFLDFLFSPCKCKCGVPNREARFKGGEHVRGYEFPWLSVIQVTGKGEDAPVPRSVIGTLINNRYVLTAASPLVDLTPYEVKITLGQFDKCFSDTSSVNVSVDKIIIHPDFSAENNAHDLALLKLSNLIIFDRRVSPICLSIPGQNYLGQVATIIGWPKQDTEKEREEKLSCRPKKLGLPVLDGRSCGYADSVPIDKGCIGVVGTASIVCPDDAGTPVMYRSYGGIYELIGVLTSQNSCEENDKGVSLYTRINDHLSWITQSTKDACYCFKT